MSHTAKEKAKAVIVEIIRQSGGSLRNKTNLFKAFWKAHVAFAQAGHCDLTAWPIVRMPNGPGIDKFDFLLGELLAEGAVETENVQYGDGISGFAFHLRSESPNMLSDSESAAVRAGVEFVGGQSAGAVSQMSHRDSRSWNAAKDGDELDVTLDSISDADYSRMRKQLLENRHVVEEAIAMRHR